MKRLFLTIACSISSLCSAVESITIEKSGTGANPGIFVQSFKGSAEERKTLEQLLLVSDWFKPVGSASSAVYTLAGEKLFAPGGVSIKMMLSGPKRTGFIVTAGTYHEAVCRAVDELIKRVFKNPGPCSSKIAFTAGAGEVKEIYAMNIDGSGQTQLTYNRNISTEATWGSSGMLTYTVYLSDRTNIMQMTPRLKQQKKLIRAPGLNSGAALSADNQWVSLTMSRGRQVDLFVKSAAGGTARQLTNDAAVEASPAWSPDLRNICYVSDKNGKPRLFLVSPNGGNSERLFSDPREMVSPDWGLSNRICFSLRKDGHYVLAYADMNTNERKMTIFQEGPGDWEAPSWAPDGRHVICTRAAGSKRAVCIVDSWYGTVIPLTGSGKYSLPDWSPALP